MITRMIFVRVPADKAAEAERLWTQDCDPWMIKHARLCH
jgi:hypothetical protein